MSHFAKVRYANLYPGIDVIFYSRDGQLEYDIVAAPGADPGAVRFEVTGTKPVPARDGAILLRARAAKFILQKPRVYNQGEAGNPVPAKYSLAGKVIEFRLGHYDHARPLIIDPALIFSTYLNSNCRFTGSPEGCMDTVANIAADASGEYVTGSTAAGAVFPATNGATQTVNETGDTETFVFKLNPAGTTILYQNYLSSSAGLAIAVDSSGAAYISGTAYPLPVAGVTSFPLTSGVFSGTLPTNPGPFFVPYVAKLSPDGSDLVYSTLLQQPGSTSSGQQVTPAGIAVDSQGAVYVTGVARSTGNYLTGFMPLPVTQGAFQTTAGTLFALKLTPNASGLAYSTYIDGTGGGGGIASGISVDANGDAFVTGGGVVAGFPTTPGVYLTTNTPGSSEAFVMELNPTGTAPIYSTFFPGPLSNGIAVDAQDEAVIVGTNSNPPATPNAFCGAPPNPPVPVAGYVTKFNATGTMLVYSTTLCGNFAEAYAVAVDSTGAAYIAGNTQQPATFQPVLVNPIDSYFFTSAGQPDDTQVTLKLDTAGNLQWATFLASAIDRGGGSRIAVDPSGAVYVLYGTSGFPTTPGSAGLGLPGLSPNSGPDLLVKIAPSLSAPVPLAYAAPITFPSANIGISSAAQDVPLGNFGDSPLAAPTISVTGDFSETDNCSSGVAAGAKCDVNVVFTPTATGTRNGTLLFSFGAGISSQSIALAGTGTAPAVSISPTSLSFGTQANGTTSALQQITVTNSGTGSLTVALIQTTAQFGQTNTCGAPIAPMGTCTIQVTFTPNTSGAQMGTLTVTDNAPNSPQTVPWREINLRISRYRQEVDRPRQPPYRPDRWPRTT